MPLRSTTSLSTGQYICWRRRLPHLAWSWLKLTPPAEAAVYILTGMETSPKEIVPDPSECGGMAGTLQIVRFCETLHGSTGPAMLQGLGRCCARIVVVGTERGEG